MRPLGVVFDMDGVLFDTETIFDNAWRQTARAMRIADIEPAIRDCRGVTPAYIREYFGRCYPEVCFDEFDRLTDQRFAEITANGVPTMPGVHELLRDLRAWGVKIALATSGERSRALHHLAQAGIVEAFDAIITGDMVANSKPAPDIYQTAAAALNLSPADCIGVEDSHNGVRSAHAAGMGVAMVVDQMPVTAEMRALTWRIFDDLPALHRALAAAFAGSAPSSGHPAS